MKDIFAGLYNKIVGFFSNVEQKEADESKNVARNRLKLVLMQDRASVSPDFFEMMKKEIIDVIKKYIEIDEESLEVQLTRGYEAGLEGPALYANIPIKNIKPVAPDGEVENEDVEKLTDAIADEILDEASQKAEEMNASVSVSLEEDDEVKVEDEPKDVSRIAENVAKEMKKSVKTASKSKSSTTRKTTTKRTTKKSSTAE